MGSAAVSGGSSRRSYLSVSHPRPRLDLRAESRSGIESIRGTESFTIQWPPDVEEVCATPGPLPANDPLPLHLSVTDRARADHAYDGFGLAISEYEFSPEVSPFTSKYDYVQAGKEQFTPQEKLGYELFRGKAGCNECHRDSGPGEETLFTDSTASNQGVPRNLGLPPLWGGCANQKLQDSPSLWAIATRAYVRNWDVHSRKRSRLERTRPSTSLQGM
jgi:hypothetical protein